MKTTFRIGVFETNSSSMHSMCIVTSDELEKFKNGELNLEAFYGVGRLTDEPRSSDVWNWDDFSNSNIDGYDMINDAEDYKDFPPGSVEDLLNGTYKLHYQV